jgi:hypothetical protein
MRQKAVAREGQEAPKDHIQRSDMAIYARGMPNRLCNKEQALMTQVMRHPGIEPGYRSSQPQGVSHCQRPQRTHTHKGFILIITRLID